MGERWERWRKCLAVVNVDVIIDFTCACWTCFRCKAVDKGSFTMQHESAYNELVAGQCRQLHASAVIS